MTNQIDALLVTVTEAGSTHLEYVRFNAQRKLFQAAGCTCL